MANINREHNRIAVSGNLLDSDLHFLLANVHHAIERAQFDDIVLDFRNCSAAFQSSMLGVCAQALAYRESNINFELAPPNNAALRKLFSNANWAYLIDPRRYAPSSFRGYTQVPAIRYRNSDEQSQAVERILNVILGAVTDIDRRDFAAFEWSIYEIMDNVLTHAESKVGGLVQVSTFQKTRKRIQYIVADAGSTIPTTLRSGHPKIGSDAEALDRAIREGITRDKALGQGNGLFGSYQICSHCKGRFEIDSGHAILRFRNEELHVHSSSIPFSGTLVVAEIDLSNPGLLAEALRFQGEPHNPVDTIELNYELEKSDCLKFVMKEESMSFGSRPAGTPVRNKLINLYEMGAHNKIYVDFREIPIVSSSFADEVFGKLFVQLGPVAFVNAFEIVNAAPTVSQLIDRAIRQRMRDSR